MLPTAQASTGHLEALQAHAPPAALQDGHHAHEDLKLAPSLVFTQAGNLQHRGARASSTSKDREQAHAQEDSV